MSVVVGIASLHAQSPEVPPQSMTLDQAVRYALDHYPAVRAALEQTNASAAGVDVARSTYLPRLDSVWQSNRATANNIFGQLLPQPAIPAMSGPVLPATSAESVWGTAAGALVTWEPIDFGLRKSTVEAAEAAMAQLRASEALTRLDVAQAVALQFLAAVSAERAVIAASADRDRRDVLARTAHALVDNQLRPGADASRADAERAAAQTRVIQGQQTLALARLALNRALGVTGRAVTPDPQQLFAQIPPTDVEAASALTHPLAGVQQAAVTAAKASEQQLSHTDAPRVYLQSSVFARGSGANPSGTFDGGATGLGFERANWAAGVQVLFPNLFDYAALRARKAAASANERLEVARYDETLLTISSEQQAAAIRVMFARDVAANTPTELAAARQSETQARARYQAGLAALSEVADAQALLAQAEYQDELARIEVWRALLAEAAAQGSLTPFLQLVGAVGVP
jgi:outer membrane protein TolC